MIGWVSGVRFIEIAKAAVLSRVETGMAGSFSPKMAEDINFMFVEVYLNKWPF